MNVKLAVTDVGADNLGHIKKLFQACSWDWLASDSDMLEAFNRSFKIYKAEVEGQLVGFGRIISDGKIYGLLVDLMIAPKFRGEGLGRQLTDFIVRQCAIDGIKIIQLLSSREGRNLYLKTGFKQCPTESPGMIKFLSSDPD